MGRRRVWSTIGAGRKRMEMPPVALPEVSVSLLWHASYDPDLGHRWLRRTIAHLAQEAGPAHGPG